MESQQRAVSELAALKTLAATSKAIKRNHTKTVNVDFFAADEKNRSLQMATRHDLTYGDLVAFPRSGYKHVEIYVGDGMVFGRDKEEVAKKRCITTVAGKSEISKINYDNDARERWSVSPGSVESIKERMRQCEENAGEYSLLFNNCETLVTYIRYGKGFSPQVNAGKNIVVGAAGAACTAAGGRVIYKVLKRQSRQESKSLLFDLGVGCSLAGCGVILIWISWN